MNIYIANIDFKADDADLKEEFSIYGKVTKCHIVTDRETGRSRGFAFVEMPDEGEAKEAIAKLNGSDFMGRKLVVNEARPQEKNGNR